METAKQKTITFEFSTVDFVPEDISNEFVKEVCNYFSYLKTTGQIKQDSSNQSDRLVTCTFLTSF